MFCIQQSISTIAFLPAESGSHILHVTNKQIVGLLLNFNQHAFKVILNFSTTDACGRKNFLTIFVNTKIKYICMLIEI